MRRSVRNALALHSSILAKREPEVVKIEAGRGSKIIREVDGGNGYAGQSVRRAHFGGLGAVVAFFVCRLESFQDVLPPVSLVWGK